MKSGAYLACKTTLILLHIFLIAVALDIRTNGQQQSLSTKRATSASWHIFSVPDGDFSLAFPAKPLPSESEAEGPVTMIRHYHLSTKDGKYFSVNFQDMGGNPSSRDANEFDAKAEVSISVAARDRGERVIQMHRLAKHIVEMEVWQPANDTLLHRLDRYIVRRARVYTLGCGSLINNTKVDKLTCRKFFNSIRFTK
jgi:hypothetical protein